MPNSFMGLDVEKWPIMESHRQTAGNWRHVNIVSSVVKHLLLLAGKLWTKSIRDSHQNGLYSFVYCKIQFIAHVFISIIKLDKFITSVYMGQAFNWFQTKLLPTKGLI